MGVQSPPQPINLHGGIYKGSHVFSRFWGLLNAAFAGFRFSYFTEQHLEDLVPNVDQRCKKHKDTAAGAINN